jgi:hypothetical protein
MSSLEATERPRTPIWSGLAAAVVIATLAAAPASAVVLPFTGTLTVDLNGIISGWTGAGSATVNGSGAGGHLSSLSLPAGAFPTAGLTTVITSPAAFPIQGLQITANNGAGAFAETGMGTLRGTMPIQGVSKVCLFAACGSAVANVSVPLSVIGVGGQGVATGAANVTVEGAPWTTGTAAIIPPFSAPLTRMGFAHGPASNSGSTAAPGGSLQLVTPIVVWTNLGVDQPSIFGFTSITLHFVPEPATFALAAGGLVLFAIAGRHRRK